VLETRLREVLREALGGTYGVQVETNASKIPETTYSVTIDFSRRRRAARCARKACCSR
jgi:hypothetical protein